MLCWLFRAAARPIRILTGREPWEGPSRASVPDLARDRTQADSNSRASFEVLFWRCLRGASPRSDRRVVQG